MKRSKSKKRKEWSSQQIEKGIICSQNIPYNVQILKLILKQITQRFQTSLDVLRQLFGKNIQYD